MKVHHVRKARKEFTSGDGKLIKKGDSYYWWKFNFGSKHTSTTYPKPQQLTKSDFKIQYYDIQDRINALEATDSIEGDLQDVISDIQNLLDETQEKLDNMPKQLQESSNAAGSMLQERIEALWCNKKRRIVMNILCWLIGHKELKLDVLKDGLIRVGDITGVLLKIKCCERCKLLYWEIFKKE